MYDENCANYQIVRQKRGKWVTLQREKKECTMESVEGVKKKSKGKESRLGGGMVRD